MIICHRFVKHRPYRFASCFSLLSFHLKSHNPMVSQPISVKFFYDLVPVIPNCVRKQKVVENPSAPCYLDLQWATYYVKYNKYFREDIKLISVSVAASYIHILLYYLELIKYRSEVPEIKIKLSEIQILLHDSPASTYFFISY